MSVMKNFNGFCVKMDGTDGTEDEDMEPTLDETIETITIISEELACFIKNQVPKNPKSYANTLTETTNNFNDYYQLLKKSKSENLHVLDHLREQIKLVEDEISEIKKEESIEVVIAQQKKKLKYYQKQNLQLKEQKKDLAKHDIKVKVLQVLTDTMIISHSLRKTIYGLIGSKEEGNQKPFKISRKEDLPRCIYQLAIEVFKDN